MKRPKILIVDSDPLFVQATEEALKDYYQVLTASSRARAVERAQKESPDIVIVGFVEPRGDAFRLHNELKSKRTTKDIPLLVVDVRSEEHARRGWKKDEGMQMEAESYLSRPVEPCELREEVARILQGSALKLMEGRDILKQMEVVLRRVEEVEEILAV